MKTEFKGCQVASRNAKSKVQHDSYLLYEKVKLQKMLLTSLVFPHQHSAFLLLFDICYPLLNSALCNDDDKRENTPQLHNGKSKRLGWSPPYITRL